MPMTLEQFLHDLTVSVLMTSDEVAEFRGLLPDKKQSPDDAQEFVRELVRQKKLTKFRPSKSTRAKARR